MEHIASLYSSRSAQRSVAVHSQYSVPPAWSMLATAVAFLSVLERKGARRDTENWKFGGTQQAAVNILKTEKILVLQLRSYTNLISASFSSFSAS